MKSFVDSLIDRMYKYKIEPHRITPGKYGLPFDEVKIPATDGAHLYGWWIPSKPDCAHVDPSAWLGTQPGAHPALHPGIVAVGI